MKKILEKIEKHKEKENKKWKEWDRFVKNPRSKQRGWKITFELYGELIEDDIDLWVMKRGYKRETLHAIDVIEIYKDKSRKAFLKL